MYIRDAQGRLRWIPPQTYGDPQMMPAPMMMVPGPLRQQQQQSMRQHVQDEWARFHAPPTADHMHYVREEQFFSRVAPTSAPNMMPPVGHMPMYSSMNRMQMHQHIHHQQQMNRYNPEPPIPRVITPVNYDRDDGPPSGVALSPSMLSSEESRSRSVSRHHSDFEEVAAPNVNCMNTLFGSQVKPPTKESMVSRMGAISCHQVNPSTTELELNIKLPNYYTEHLNSTGKNVAMEAKSVEASQDKPSSMKSLVSNPMQAFHCNGIRGPGKKFDYSCTSPGISEMDGFGGDGIPVQLEEKGLLALALAKRAKKGLVPPVPTFNQAYSKAVTGQINPHDSFDDVSYLVETRYVPQKKKNSQKYQMKKQPIVEPESPRGGSKDKCAPKTKDYEQQMSRDDDRRKNSARSTVVQSKDKMDKSSNDKRRSSSDDVGEASAMKPKGTSIMSDRSDGKVDRHRHHVQWDDVDGNGTKHEGPIFSAKDQADLAKSIREICLERIGRAPSDLEYLEEYPSFDEHKKQKTAVPVVEKHGVRIEDEVASDTSSSGVENKPEHANNNKVAEMSSSSKSSSAKSSSKDKKRSETVGVVKTRVTADVAATEPKPSVHPYISVLIQS